MRAHSHDLDGKYHDECIECLLIKAAVPKADSRLKSEAALLRYQRVAERIKDDDEA